MRVDYTWADESYKKGYEGAMTIVESLLVMSLHDKLFQADPETGELNLENKLSIKPILAIQAYNALDVAQMYLKFDNEKHKELNKHLKK